MNLDELTNVSTSERESITRVYNDLLAHREAICVPYESIQKSDKPEVLNIFLQDELASGMYDATATRKIRSALYVDTSNNKDAYVSIPVNYVSTSHTCKQAHSIHENKLLKCTQKRNPCIN